MGVVCVAFLVLLERFLLRLIQNRVGPRVIRFFRLLQTIVDRRKLFFKQFYGFLIFCFLFFTLQFNILGVVLFFVFCILRLTSILLLIINFLNFRTFSVFSLFRTNIMSICFDVIFSFLVLSIIFCSNNIFWFFGLCLFFVLLMEVRRTPYDLNERESELVSRYNLEYSRIGFTFLFLREYLRLLFFVVLIRAILPRFKFFGVFSHAFRALNSVIFCFL